MDNNVNKANSDRKKLYYSNPVNRKLQSDRQKLYYADRGNRRRKSIIAHRGKESWGIYMIVNNGIKYRVVVASKHIGYYNTLDFARIARDDAWIAEYGDIEGSS